MLKLLVGILSRGVFRMTALNPLAKKSWPIDPRFMLGFAPFISLFFGWTDTSPFFEEVFSRGQILGRDFITFWVGAVLFWRGHAQQLFDPVICFGLLREVTGKDIATAWFSYPPNSLLLLFPLAALPYFPALFLWLAGPFTLLAGLLRRYLAIDWPIILALLLSPASVVNICAGQNGFLSALLFCGGFLMLERRPILAGILFGLLAYKPQIGLILPFLLIAGKYWRTFFWRRSRSC